MRTKCRNREGIFRAGAGDDIIGISDTNFARIDGGAGADILRLDGTGISLDLTAVLPSIISDIETIDLTGSGDNTLTLNVSDVFDITTTRSGGKAIVYVTGNAGDSVSFADGGDWTGAGSTVVNSVTFNRYTNGNAELRIQNGVTSNVAGDPIVLDLGGDGFSFAGAVAFDLNADGISEAGELTSLGDLGIASINLDAQAQSQDVDGVQIYAQGSVTFDTGEIRDFVEVGFSQIDDLFW